MKKMLILIFVIVSNVSLAQNLDSSITPELIKKFQDCKNDKKFINHNSDTKYKEYVVNIYSQKDSNLIEFGAVSISEINEINGPFYTDSSTFYTKTIKIDSAYMTRVGNIWLSKSRGETQGSELAKEILTKINNGKDFNTFCILYSDDKNQNYDCDLGWVFNTNYVQTFSDEVINHKKNEVFIVKTTFGYHVVKIIDDSYEKRKSITYVKLELKK